MSDEKIVLKKKTNVKRLGMGLSALLGGAADDIDIFSSNEIKNIEDIISLKGYAVIELSKIHPNEAQPRRAFLEKELLELADSITKNGVLQPILVRKTEGETFEIVAGERRYRASKLAGLKEIPCIIRELTDEQVFLLAIVENIQRENLNPLEEAESYTKLIKEFNYKQEQIAEMVNKSRSHISNVIRLSKLPKAVKEMVVEGKLTGGHVRPLLALKTEEQIKNVADVIMENNYSVRKVEELVNLILNDEEKLEMLETGLENINKQTLGREKVIEISALIEEISLAFQEKFEVPIKIKPSKKGGVISIKYKTEGELEKIMQNFVNIKKPAKIHPKFNMPGKDELLNIDLNFS